MLGTESNVPPHAHHPGAALRERQHPPRPPRRGGADRRLRPRHERARQGGDLHLRRRHARHAHRDERGQGGGAAGGVHRGHPPRAPRRLQGLRDRIRSLLHHALAGERTARGAHLQGLAEGRRHREARRLADVLRDRQALPARPLHPRHLPRLRHRRSIRRQLRELRQHLPAHRAQESALRHLRQHRARAAQLAALLQKIVALPGLPTEVDFDARAPAAGDQELRRQVALRAAARLGHLARRALLRLQDPGRRFQVLLRLARRAGRIPLLDRPLVPGARPPRRGVLGQGRRLRRDALHRQGHRLFPHALLAGDAARLELEGAAPDTRARHAHGRGRQDEQVAGDVPQCARIHRRGARPGVAALFLRGESICR